MLGWSTRPSQASIAAAVSRVRPPDAEWMPAMRFRRAVADRGFVPPARTPPSSATTSPSTCYGGPSRSRLHYSYEHAAAAGGAPRVPAVRAHRRPGRRAAAAHNPLDEIPPPLDAVRPPPGGEGRRGRRRDRCHRQRRLPQGPRVFRGGCVSTATFDAAAYCNNKLVGAKFFYKGFEAKRGRPFTEREKSPIDTNGHGTHATSIAAGAEVRGASFFTYGKGNTVGAAPGARIASYKACWSSVHTCTDSDVLAAFDEAIADGVQVISVSFGSANGAKAPEFHNDTVAMASFRAVRNGIVVSASAGNEGPGKSTVKNIAPWLITVGASTIKRHYPATLVLGDGSSYTGSSLYVGAPLISEAKVPLGYGGKYCNGKLDPKKISRKILLCDPSEKGKVTQAEAVRFAGGAGIILPSQEEEGEQTHPIPYIIPAISVPFSDYLLIYKYVQETESPTATIKFGGTVINMDPPAPRVAQPASSGDPEAGCHRT
ncbi:hypothetical protein EJB05_26536, partial [Eragrostis curvula]